MIDKLEIISKKVVVAYSRYYTGICVEGLRKATRILSEDSRFLGRDSNRALSKYTSEALLLTPTFTGQVQAKEKKVKLSL
jgi:hypothetical protein